MRRLGCRLKVESDEEWEEKDEMEEEDGGEGATTLSSAFADLLSRNNIEDP